MKKLTALLLTMVLIASTLFGCGEFDGIKDGPTDIPNGSDPIVPDGPVDPSLYFSVNLIFEDEAFTATDGISVQWVNKDTGAVHRAAFGDGESTAKIAGLDGDYTVTLVGLPDSYMYDPNGNVASNTKKHIDIVLYEHVKPRGTGSGPYNPIEINRLGAYTTTLTKGKTVHYEFKPTRAGTYVIETVCNVTENEVNPKIDVWNGSFANKNYSYTVDAGGTSADYTRNAKYVVTVDAQNVGASYSFAVNATHKTDVYPVTVNFIVKFSGDYTNPDYYINSTIIIPDQQALIDRGKIGEPTGTLHYPERYVSPGVYVFDSSLFKLNEEDGYYHLYDEKTGTYGPVLYAKITRRHRFFADFNGSEVSFAGGPQSICVEDPGNKALQVLENGTENYKLFIQGASACQDVVGMENCSGFGYANFVNNTEGVYPVTEELKIFLQKFSVSQRYFNDGNGWAETTAEDELGYRIYSSENDQWLFACCYYS